MVLLDTHAFVWIASDQRKLSKAARAVLGAPRQSAALSIVTAWEIALLCKRERLLLPLPASDFLQRAIEHHHLVELPLHRDLVLRSVHLPDIHNDPFDRILIATAQEHKVPLISKDRMISQYPDVAVVW